MNVLLSQNKQNINKLDVLPPNPSASQPMFLKKCGAIYLRAVRAAIQ